MPLVSRLVTHAATVSVAVVLVGAVDVMAADIRSAGCTAPLVVGAQQQISACLADLTTAGTVASGHTVPADWVGLQSASATNPSGVPGIQIDGYFPDSSAFNTHHGWNHDSQFVIRLPEHWNGGLVVTGTPGNRRQYANDFTISDWVLSQGYAYAATDKGNSGSDFHQDGVAPGDAIVEWHQRLTQLTIATQAAVLRRYGRPAERTIAAGLSNGGYLVRWQLEQMPWLYDGGVEWAGTLWSDEANLLRFLPPVLGKYPNAPEDIVAAGFPAESAPLWDYHDKTYWSSTQRIYRAEFDPAYSAAESDYDYAARPESVRAAVRRVALTGRLQRPLLTVHGTLDALLPIGEDSDVYASMVRAHGSDPLHRYYRVEGGNHVDGLYDSFPDLLRPLLPCFRSAFTALESWTTTQRLPPPSATLSRPASGAPVDTCDLGG